MGYCGNANGDMGYSGNATLSEFLRYLINTLISQLLSQRVTVKYRKK